MCVSYELSGKNIDYLPAASEDQFKIKPVCKSFPGWKTKTQGIRNINDLPENAKKYISELEKFSPEIINYCKLAIEKDVEDLDFLRLESESFRKCPKISLDIAVMEKTKLGVVLPLDKGWSDVGNWLSLWENSKKDENGNCINGRVINHSSKDSFL